MLVQTRDRLLKVLEDDRLARWESAQLDHALARAHELTREALALVAAELLECPTLLAPGRHQ